MSNNLFDKKGIQFVKQDNMYNIKFNITNKNIIIEKLINLDLITLLYELNKTDIFSEYNCVKHTDTSASIYILFNHFFKDFGLSQKYIHLDISIVKEDTSIIFNMTTNYNINKNKNINDSEVIPFDSIILTCDILNVHNISCNANIYLNTHFSLPDFIETLVINIIGKVFIRTKQFIEKYSYNVCL